MKLITKTIITIITIILSSPIYSYDWSSYDLGKYGLKYKNGIIFSKEGDVPFTGNVFYKMNI